MSPSRRATSDAAHREPPRSDATPHPARLMLHGLRAPARALVRRRLDVRVHDGDHVPAAGPVVLAANHIGIADGPLLAAFAPRPVHALTKVEMFEGRMGRFLRAAGQIPLDRFHTDVAAVRSSLRVLRDGGVVAVFPEGRRGAGDLARFHRGAAYLGLVTGAPVVPVTILGSREPGGHTDSVPPRGSVVHLVFGPAYPMGRQPWPRTKEQVGHASALLREHMLVQLDQARASTGVPLPGPLPAHDVEPDPATGVTEQGAS